MQKTQQINPPKYYNTEETLLSKATAVPSCIGSLCIQSKSLTINSFNSKTLLPSADF